MDSKYHYPHYGHPPKGTPQFGKPYTLNPRARCACLNHIYIYIYPLKGTPHFGNPPYMSELHRYHKVPARDATGGEPRESFILAMVATCVFQSVT